MGADASHKAALALLALAALGWYLATRTLTDALAGQRIAPGRRALGFWIPSLLLVLISLIFGKPEVAIGIPFATSVACASLVLGIVTVAARSTEQTLTRRTWGFLLPTALITLLIGFSGGIRLFHAMLLSLNGLAILLLWNDTAPTRQASTAHARSHAVRTAQVAAALAAATVSAWAAIHAAQGVSNYLELPSSGLPAALMLTPALILPMIGSGSLLASHGRYDEAVSSLVGFILLNLCALLPLATVGWVTRPYWHRQLAHVQRVEPATTQPTTDVDPADTKAEALRFPLAVWRVDTVMLIALGLLLLPVAMGRWTIGPFEGYALLLVYVVYMTLTALLAR